MPVVRKRADRQHSEKRQQQLIDRLKRLGVRPSQRSLRDVRRRKSNDEEPVERDDRRPEVEVQERVAEATGHQQIREAARDERSPQSEPGEPDGKGRRGKGDEKFHDQLSVVSCQLSVTTDHERLTTDNEARSVSEANLFRASLTLRICAALGLVFVSRGPSDGVRNGCHCRSSWRLSLPPRIGHWRSERVVRCETTFHCRRRNRGWRRPPASEG